MGGGGRDSKDHCEEGPPCSSGASMQTVRILGLRTLCAWYQAQQRKTCAQCGEASDPSRRQETWQGGGGGPGGRGELKTHKKYISW